MSRPSLCAIFLVAALGSPARAKDDPDRGQNHQSHQDHGNPGHKEQRGHERPLGRGERAPSFGPLGVVNPEAAGVRSFSFSGKPAGASDPGAQVVVLSFFATWCPGCVNELPALRRLDENYRARGVRIVSVSIDRGPDSARRLADLLSSAQVRHPVLADMDQRVLRSFEGGSVSLPFLFVIGADGRVADTHEGFDDETEAGVRATLETLLGAQR